MSVEIDEGGQTDAQFVQFAYRAVLNREVDSSGLQNSLNALKAGANREDIIKSLAYSEEFLALRLQHAFGQECLPNLIELAPAKYQRVRYAENDKESQVFKATKRSDWDWLERHIIDDGYYDTVGTWPLGRSAALDVIASQVASLLGRSVLEIGCSTGQVIGNLKDRGWKVMGMEVSHLALALAPKSIRSEIMFGDFLEYKFDTSFDVVCGMDIFEHLNPNKIDQYIGKCVSLINKGGALFTNIPTFGPDKIFGEVFRVYLEPWVNATSFFQEVEVDDKGWPHGGHMLLARPEWWQSRFEFHGLTRMIKEETKLQTDYADFFKESPARRSSFIFRKLG